MRTYIIRRAVGREGRVFAERAAVDDRSGARSFFFHTPFGPSTQKLRTFSHTKIIIRSTCAHCARKKRAAVCIFQPFEGVFSFYCTHCAQIGHEFSILFEQPPHYRAYLLGLHVLTILAFVGIARFFYTVSKQKNGVCPSMGRTDAQKRPNRRRTHGVSVGGLAVVG